jgi:TetR/AcrR family transcriptional repressor of nem operon
VADVPLDERSEPIVQSGEGMPVTGSHGEQQCAFFVALREESVVHQKNVTYRKCTCKYTLAMRSDHASRTSRRTTAKGLATRNRIVVTAADLMLTRGISGTTLDDIGAAATVGRSQMYHYFADKQELVRDVVRQQTDAIIAHQGPDYGDLTTWDAWQRWRDRTVADAEAGGCVGGCPLGSLGTEVAERDADTRDLVAAGFARWEQGFHDGIRTMRERGLLGPDADPAALATTVMVALQGGLLLAQVQRDVRPLAIGLDTAITSIRRHATDSGVS